MWQKPSMKLTASIVTAALCAAFAREARAQIAVRPVDESAAFVEPLDPDAHLHFEAALAPHGDWSDDPRYGRVWSPSARVVGADFSPYATGGRWSLSQYGLTWTSSYPWGWAPFHYGRWVTLPMRGWSWVPGTTWGPAWVSWRVGGGFAGWAPLPPEGTAQGMGAASWRFVPASQLGAARPSYLTAVEVASVYPSTASCNPARAMTVNARIVRYSPGPTGLAGQAAMREGPLSDAALPRADIAAPDAAAPNEAVTVAPSRLAGASGYWAGRPAYAPAPPPGSVYAQPLITPPGWYRPAGRWWGRAPPPSAGAGGSWVGSAPPGYPSSGYQRGGGQSSFAGGSYGGGAVGH
jgi:hypothetical protein